MLEKLVVNVDSITTNVIIVSVQLNGDVYQGALVKASVHKLAKSYFGSILDPVHCDNTLLLKGVQSFGANSVEEKTVNLVPSKENLIEQTFKNSPNPIECATDLLRELDDVLDPYLDQITDTKNKDFLKDPDNLSCKTSVLSEKFIANDNKTLEHNHSIELYRDYYTYISPAALFRCTYYRNPAIVADYYHKSSFDSTTDNRNNFMHNGLCLETNDLPIPPKTSPEPIKVLTSTPTLIEEARETQPPSSDENEHALYYGKNFIWPWPVPTKTQIIKRTQAKPRRYICIKCRAISMQSPRNVPALNGQELVQCNQITNNPNDKIEEVNNNVVINYDTFVENQFFKLNDKGKPVAANMSSSAPLFHNPNVIETNLLLPLTNLKADDINYGKSHDTYTPTKSVYPCKIGQFISNSSLSKPVTRSHISGSSHSTSAKRALNRRYSKEEFNKPRKHLHSHRKHYCNELNFCKTCPLHNKCQSQPTYNKNSNISLSCSSKASSCPVLDCCPKNYSQNTISSNTNVSVTAKNAIPNNIQGDTSISYGKNSSLLINATNKNISDLNNNNNNSKRVPKLKLKIKKDSSEMTETLHGEGSTKCLSPSSINLHKNLMVPSNITAASPSKRPRLKMVFRRNKHSSLPTLNANENTVSNLYLDSSPTQRKLGRPKKRKWQRRHDSSNIINLETNIKQEFDQATLTDDSKHERTIKNLASPCNIPTDVEIKPEQSTDSGSTLAASLEASESPINISTTFPSSQADPSFMVIQTNVVNELLLPSIAISKVQSTDINRATSFPTHVIDADNDDDDSERGVLYIDLPPDEASSPIQTVPATHTPHPDTQNFINNDLGNASSINPKDCSGVANTIFPPTKKRGRRKKKKGRPRTKDKLFNGPLPKHKKVLPPFKTNSDITILPATTKLLNDNNFLSTTTTTPNLLSKSHFIPPSQRLASQYVSYSLNCESLVAASSKKSCDPPTKIVENSKCPNMYNRPNVGVIKTNPNINSPNTQFCSNNNPPQTIHQTSSTLCCTETVVTCVQSPKVPDHSFILGDVVWGKIQGYPWWPAQIIEFRKKYVDAPASISGNLSTPHHHKSSPRRSITSLPSISAPSTLSTASNSLSALNESWENGSNKSNICIADNEFVNTTPKTDKIGITRCLLSWYGEAEPRSISEVGLKDVLPFREFYERYSTYFGPLPPNFVALPQLITSPPLATAEDQPSVFGPVPTTSCNSQTSVIKLTGFETPPHPKIHVTLPQASITTPMIGIGRLGSANTNISVNKKSVTNTNRTHSSNFAAAQDPTTRAAMQISFRDALVQASQDLHERIHTLPSDK